MTEPTGNSSRAPAIAERVAVFVREDCTDRRQW